MKNLKRWERMVRYFRRKKEGRASELARTRGELARVRREIERLAARRAAVNRAMGGGRSGRVDVDLLALCSEFKLFLEQEIASRSQEAEALGKKENEALRLVWEARREEKVWERLKEKRQEAISEQERTAHLSETDDLAAQRKATARQSPWGTVVPPSG